MAMGFSNSTIGASTNGEIGLASQIPRDPAAPHAGRHKKNAALSSRPGPKATQGSHRQRRGSPRGIGHAADDAVWQSVCRM